MTTPSVTMRVETEAGTEDKLLDAVNGTLEVEFAPAAARVEIDYSKQDALTLRIAGEFAPPRWNGLSLAVGGAIDRNGAPTVTGAMSWEIAKHVDAKMDVSYGTDGMFASGKLTIRF